MTNETNKPTATDTLMAEALKAASAAMGAAADKAGSDDTSTSNGADKAPQGVTAATNEAPRVLPDLTKTAPTVNVSAAAGKAKAKGGKAGKAAATTTATATTSDDNGNSAPAPAPWHRYRLENWPKFMAHLKPNDAFIIWAFNVNKFTPNTKHSLAYAYYHVQGSEAFSAHDVGYAVALCSWGIADNKSNAALQNAHNGNCFLTRAYGLPPRNPEATSQAGKGNVGYHCCPYQTAPDGTIEAIRFDKIKRGYEAIRAAGLKIPVELLPPNMPVGHDVLTRVPGIKYRG